MNSKLSQRDKVLLIVLVLVIVVFAAVMIPTYGIKDLIVSIRDTKTAIATQQQENNDTLVVLRSKGIPSGMAENAAGARNYLARKSLELKFQAAKVSQLNVNTDAYGVAEGWLLPLMYVDCINGNDTEGVRIMEFMTVNVSSGYSINEIDVAGNLYNCNLYSCNITCEPDSVNTYLVDLQYSSDETNLDQLAFIIALYTIAEERGSISVENYMVENELGGEQVVLSITLRVPQGALLSSYAKEICECHHCGHVYSVSQYEGWLADSYEEVEEPGVVHCPECDEVIDGETLG